MPSDLTGVRYTIMLKVRSPNLYNLSVILIASSWLGVLCYKNPELIGLYSACSFLLVYFFFKPKSDFDVFSLAILLGLFVYPVYYVKISSGQDFSFCILLAAWFLALPNDGLHRANDVALFSHYRLLMLFLVIFSCLAIPAILWMTLYFLACASIVPLSKTSASRLTPYVWLFLLVVALLLRATLSWDGFGRIVYVSYLFVPLIFSIRARILIIPVLSVPLLVIAGLYLTQLIRADSVVSIEGLFMGSAGHHIVVTSDIFRLGPIYPAAQFFEQYFLMFFNWLPRAIISDKPFGIGFSSVYDIYPAAPYYGVNYSHSVGFVGESFAFFGDFFFVGLLLYAGGIAFINKLVGLFVPKVAVLGSIVVYISVISFLWGGGAAFGARIWEPMIAVVLCNILLYANVHISRRRTW
jgi:hypothetical protein